ncbi:MAG: arsenical pump-driving ATPase [Desulfobulbaceae bacterium]
MNFLTDPTRFLFFTGKGGVGKTSLSCATAVHLADQGKKVFLVCTDPASNLNEVLGTRIGSEPCEVNGVPGLRAVNINPEEAAARYREKVVGPYRGKLPDAVLASMEEQLSGACTMEIAAFDEFAGLLGDEDALGDVDHVVFDTAPTGHTLRLLQLPSAWDEFIDTNTTGTSCLGPLSGLTHRHALYKQTIATLTDPVRTTVVLVCRPDGPSVSEAARTAAELDELGMTTLRLAVNGVFRSDSDDAIARAWVERGKKALAALPGELAALERIEVGLLPHAPLGVDRLRGLWKVAAGEDVAWPMVREAEEVELPPPVEELFAAIARQGRGVIMTMGKGGVGKTTMATSLARFLAGSGHRVLLATTDPAAHLDLTLGDRMENLAVTRIDPKAETEKYSRQVMESAGANLDEEGKKLLAEDLRSPCTEEIAVFQAFAALVEQGTDRFIVLDTAPTGHTLLLLDAARAYHREVERTTRELPGAVTHLLPRMRDPAFTSIFILTLPELTPITEAKQLESDLLRADITPRAWIVNQSLAPLTLTDPFLAARRGEELPLIAGLAAEKGDRLFIAEWREPDDR